ncbi:MAG: hypothetical protein QGM49_06800, partial [Actinomycetota bacterium]|nr:hypothetical protein [Actinomycetota bacterium]
GNRSGREIIVAYDEVPNNNTASAGRAGEKYEIVVKSAPVPKRWLRRLGSLAAGVVSQGTGFIPGGQRIRVKDRVSGETVAEFKQGFGNDVDVAGDLMGKLTRLSIEEFEDEFIPTP